MAEKEKAHHAGRYNGLQSKQSILHGLMTIRDS